MRKVVMAGAVALGLVVSGGARAEFGPDVNIPGTWWSISVDKEQGICVIGANYKNGYGFGVIQAGSNYRLVLSNETVKFTSGNTYNIQIQFRGRPEWYMVFTAVNAHLLIHDTGAEFITELSRAELMSISNDRGVVVAQFDLSGSAKALSLLGACADSFSAPFGEGRPNQSQPFGRGKERGA